MSSFTQFEELMTQIEARIAQLTTQVGPVQVSLEKIKSYEDVVGSKEPKQMVGLEVNRHSLVNARLADISVNLIRVRTLKKALGQGTIPPALVGKMQVRIDRLIKDLEDLREAYKPLANAYEARLRFYNSCTYHM